MLGTELHAAVHVCLGSVLEPAHVIVAAIVHLRAIPVVRARAPMSSAVRKPVHSLGPCGPGGSCQVRAFRIRRCAVDGSIRASPDLRRHGGG